MNRNLVIFIILLAASCSAGRQGRFSDLNLPKTVLNINPEGKGDEISIELYQGESFYYPLMAAWVEDESGNYIQTLYVPQSVARGVFRFGKIENNHWVPAPKRAPQTLPYWAHKRGVKASDGLYMPEPDNPVPDAYSGATPVNGFVMNARTDKKLPEKYKVLFEINQNWDWNEYWTNDKFPEEEYYRMSCQPALVYEAIINSKDVHKRYLMNPIGHSHYSGKTGELFTDLTTLTTALEIADSIIVRTK